MKLGLPDDGSKPKSTTERRAYDLLSQGFGVGFNGPLTLVVYAPGHTDTLKLVTGELPAGAEKPLTLLRFPSRSANPKGDVVIVNVIPTLVAVARPQTNNLVKQLRAGAAKIRQQTGINAYVTGPTASNIDVSNKLSSALPEFLIVIVVLALLLLLLVFRSLLVPIKAVVGFLLSIGASFGLTVWVFQEGHLGEPAQGRDARPDRQLPADPRRRHPVRIGHGLSGFPGVAGARGLRPSPRRACRRSTRACATAPAW